MKARINLRKEAAVLLFFSVISSALMAGDVITLQTGWKFARGNYERASQVSFDDSKWQNVTIPHDWAIEGPVIPDGDGNTGKLPWRGEGWYRTKLDIPASQTGKREPPGRGDPCQEVRPLPV